MKDLYSILVIDFLEGFWIFVVILFVLRCCFFFSCKEVERDVKKEKRFFFLLRFKKGNFNIYFVDKKLGFEM